MTEMMLITPAEYDDAMRSAYNRGWNECTIMVLAQRKAALSKRAQRTSKAAVARNADSIKGMQKAVYDAISRNPLGLTDFDLEDALGRSHQSVSAARNTLMNAGLVTDSGKTRPNARGNRCIVWVVSSPSSKDVDVPQHDPVPVPSTGPNGGRTTITVTHTCHASGLYYDNSCAACVIEKGQR